MTLSSTALSESFLWAITVGLLQAARPILERVIGEAAMNVFGWAVMPMLLVIGSMAVITTSYRYIEENAPESDKGWRGTLRQRLFPIVKHSYLIMVLTIALSLLFGLGMATFVGDVPASPSESEQTARSPTPASAPTFTTYSPKELMEFMENPLDELKAVEQIGLWVTVEGTMGLVRQRGRIFDVVVKWSPDGAFHEKTVRLYLDEDAGRVEDGAAIVAEGLIRNVGATFMVVTEGKLVN